VLAEEAACLPDVVVGHVADQIQKIGHLDGRNGNKS